MTTAKLCLQCGEPIKGRSDKKFCDDQCRSAYNNKANSDATAGMRNITNALRKNRRILSQLCGSEGKTKTTRTKLNEAGFDFKYHTHTYTTQKGAVYKLVFDYGYLPLEGDWFMLVHWSREQS